MRALLKTVASAVAWVFTAPLAYPIRWMTPFDRYDHWFRFGSQVVSIIPGTIGVYMRRQYYRVVLDGTLEDLVVEFGTIFARRGTQIGSNVYIGAYCTIGLSTIEDDVLIGSSVDIVSGKRVHYFDRVDVPIRLQGGELEQITIGRNSWLGNKVVVMAPVGTGCVVGAGSIVTSPCEAESIYAGNPARRIRSRAGHSAVVEGHKQQ